MAGEGEKKKEEEGKRCCLQRSHGTTRQWWHCKGRDPHPTRAQEWSGLLVLPPGRHNLIQGGSQSAFSLDGGQKWDAVSAPLQVRCRMTPKYTRVVLCTWCTVETPLLGQNTVHSATTNPFRKTRVFCLSSESPVITMAIF